MSPPPYTIQLKLSRARLPGERADEYDVELIDTERAGVAQRAGAGTAFLDLRQQSIPGLGVTVDAFLDAFLRGDGGTQEDGLRFGQHLLGCLLADAEVRALWDEIDARRKAAKRPLRLEIVLPADDAGAVSDVPFELLADGDGPLFRHDGATLVRTIRTRDAGKPRIAPTDRPRQRVFFSYSQADDDHCGHLERHLAALRREGAIETWHGHRIAPGEDWRAGIGKALREADLILLLISADFLASDFCVDEQMTHAIERHRQGAAHVIPIAVRPVDWGRLPFASLPALPRDRRPVTLWPDIDEAWTNVAEGIRRVVLAEAIEKAAESLRDPEAPRAGEVERAPARWPHFRGRDDEVAQGLRLLGAGRLVSVTGIAGTGKTEVALEIAREAAKEAGLGLDRAIWLALDGMTRADAVRATIAAAFGAEAKDCPDDAALARRIGAARALVALDNAEDPIRGDRAGMKALVETLLGACGGLRLLLATRERLGGVRAAEEEEIRVGKLRERDAREVFASVAGARLSKEEREGEDIGKLLAWLDGHPLSLVLVARQVGTMSLGALLRRLERDGAEAVQAAEWFGEEVPADRDEKLRKERLASSLNLSFKPLVEKARGAAEMFAWLGHFPAGLPGVLVPIVFGERGEENRAILLRKCLAEEVGREKRLVLPAPVRAYALAKAAGMEEGRRVELLTASFGSLAAWFRALYDKLGRPGAREAMDHAARDAGSLRALLESSQQLGGLVADSPGATALAEAVSGAALPFSQIMQYAGRAQGATELAEAALSCVVRVASGPASANVLKALGDLYVRTARLEDAARTYDEALPLYRAIDDRLGEANVLAGMGNLMLAQGAPARAFQRYLEALARHGEIEDMLGVAAAHGYLARASLVAGNALKAVVLGRRALKTLRDIDDRFGQMLALLDLGRALGALEREEDASAALVLAWSHAAAIQHPLAQQMSDATGSADPPSAEDAEQAEPIVAAAIAACEQELQARGEDPYSPLAPDPSP
jgi:tetratricopeptide (TPR) repeat protein